MTFDSMTLILPQIKFEEIPSKDAEEVAFQTETDRSHQILDFCHNSLSLVVHVAHGSDFKIFGLPVKRPF